MKHCMAFVVYLIALFAYVAVTKDYRFLVIVIALFFGVAAATFFGLMFVDRWRGPSPGPLRRVTKDL